MQVTGHIEILEKDSIGGVEREPNVFDRRWQLFVPQNLMKILSQGGAENDNV
jgi:hypothetical protein